MNDINNRYFSLDDTLWNITERYPETLPIFFSNGFKQMEESEKRKTFGNSISLKTALSLKKLNIETFCASLIERIDQERQLADKSLQTSNILNNLSSKLRLTPDIRIKGLLPCPVRIPLLEQFETFATQYKESLRLDIDYELKAASMGLDWIKESIINEKNPDNIPDIMISAGFDLFFEENLMGKFKRKNIFVDSTGFEKLNTLFDNDHINLKDPKGHYSMIGVVPAVLLVNTKELNGRSIPHSWKDILEPEFEHSVSLPISDFDLFNAILLHIHKIYGDKGIEKLSKCLMENMHPSQMVKSHTKKNERPAVTVMPYFFSKMIKDGGPMQVVWPEEGAIISPIFMLTKRNKIKNLQPIINFLASQNVGEILSHKGLAPSIHPDVDNRIPPDKPFLWLGWDYIYKNNIGQLIEHCKTVFNDSLIGERQ